MQDLSEPGAYAEEVLLVELLADLQLVADGVELQLHEGVEEEGIMFFELIGELDFEVAVAQEEVDFIEVGEERSDSLEDWEAGVQIHHPFGEDFLIVAVDLC